MGPRARARAAARPYLELNQHAFAAHASGAPQVVDVFVFLVQLPGAHGVFAGAVVTCGHQFNEAFLGSAALRRSLCRNRPLSGWKDSPTSAKLLSNSSLCELNQE